MTGPTSYRLPPYRGHLVLALAYGCVGAAGSFLLNHVASGLWTIAPRLAIPWLPAGIGVAGLMIGGRRLWPALFVAALVVWIGVVQLPWLTGVVDAIGIVIGYVVVVRLLQAWGFRPTFDRVEDPLLLLAAAATGVLIVEIFDLASVPLTEWLAPATMTAEMKGLVRATAAGVPIPTRSFLATSVRWWLNATAGIVLVVPPIISGVLGTQRPHRERLVERLLFGMASLLWGIGALALPVPEARLPMLISALALVTWAAVRFGVTIASAGTLAFSIVAAHGFLWQLGPLSTISPSEGIETLWAFVAILTVSSLFLTSLLAERERVSDALMLSEERLRQAVRASEIGIYDHRLDEDEIYWSPEQRRTFGFSPSETVTYRRVLDAVHPEDREMIAAAIERARDPQGDGQFDLEHRILHPDGGVRWALARSCTFFAGEGASRRAVRTIGAVLDITERKRADEALRLGESRLIEAQRLGSMGSWEYDWIAGRLRFSAEAVSIFEFDPAMEERPRGGFAGIAHPEDQDLVRRTFAEVLSARRSRAELTHRLLMADGRTKFVTERWETAFTPEGRPVQSRGTVQDITERRQLESAASEAADGERRRLASELHDNLGQILFATSLMVGSFAKGTGRSDPERDAALEEITASMNEALEVCRHLAHTVAPAVEGGLGAALRDLAARSSASGTRCIVRCSEAAAASLSGSQALELYRIAQEAMTNALKHSRGQLIAIHVRLRGPTLQMSIRDNGVGIPASSAQGGEGLGLRTMRYRAERAGGTIQISTGPKGTSLRVLVPLLGRNDVASSEDLPHRLDATR